MPVYAKGPGKWRIRIYVGGKPKDEIFHGTKKEARELEARRRLELAAQDPNKARRTVPTFSEFSAGEYKAFCLEHVKASWWDKQRYIVATWIQLYGDLKLNKFDKAVVNAFKVKRREAGLRTSSVNNELRVLSRVLSVAREEFEYPVPPLKITYLPEKGRGRAVAWTDEEVGRLFKACEKHDVELLGLIVFIANTGCRNGEALALEWKHVDLEHGFIRFWPSEFWQPKSNKPREVPIGDALLPWLQEPHRHARYVFPSKAGDRFAYWPKNRWKVVRDEAKLKGGVHQLRHTYASHFLAANPDLVLLAEVLGHSDIAVTKLYKHMLPNYLARARNAVNFVPPVGPAAVEAKRRWKGPPKKKRAAKQKTVPETVPETVPTTVENSVTIERDTGFEPATFSLGS